MSETEKWIQKWNEDHKTFYIPDMLEAYAIHERERMLNVSEEDIKRLFPFDNSGRSLNSLQISRREGAKALLNHLKKKTTQ